MTTRWWLVGLCALVVLAGAIFALQGAGYLPGQVMHGKVEWLVIGLLMFLAGLALGLREMRRGRA